MKKLFLLLFLLFITSISYSQKKSIAVPQNYYDTTKISFDTTKIEKHHYNKIYFGIIYDPSQPTGKGGLGINTGWQHSFFGKIIDLGFMSSISIFTNAGKKDDPINLTIPHNDYTETNLQNSCNLLICPTAIFDTKYISFYSGIGVNFLFLKSYKKSNITGWYWQGSSDTKIDLIKIFGLDLFPNDNLDINFEYSNFKNTNWFNLRIGITNFR